MKFIKVLTLMLAATLVLSGCTKLSGSAIKINDKVITKSEFYSDFNKVKNVQFKNLSDELKADDSYLVLVFKSKYVNDLIFRELINQELDKRNIQASDDEVNAKKQEIIEQIGSEEKLKEILKENGASEERLQKDLRNEIRTLKLLEQLNVPKITDKDAQKFYNDNKKQFDMPERVLVAHILIDTNPDNIKRKIVDADKNAKLSNEEINKKVDEEVAKQKALLQKVLKEAKANPKNFAQLAKEYSQDEQSAKNGGKLGYIIRGQFVPEFEKVAFSQKVGTISEPVKTQFGEHIIMVDDKAQKGLQPFSKVKEDIKGYLDQQSKIATLQKFAQGLRDKSSIEFIDESLNPVNIQRGIEEAMKKQSGETKNKEPKDLKKIKNK